MMENTLKVRYSEKLPVLKYVVPFSFGHNGKVFDKAKEEVLASGKWKMANRSDIVPSHEEDLYDHVYSSIMEAGEEDTNIGIAFCAQDAEKQCYRYSFYDINGKEKHCDFFISDASLYIFKTGVGFYVFEAFLPKDCSLSLDELVVFQNRFKELNSVRGNQSEGVNKYSICPISLIESSDEKKVPYYTLGQDIALKLKEIFDDVFYYPPRVNELIRMDKKRELHEQWDKKRCELEAKGIFASEKKFKKIKKEFDKKQQVWNQAKVSNINELLDGCSSDRIRVVPDKSILFSYVVMVSEREPEDEREKDVLINSLCKNAYYLTRGYKSSYKVADNPKREKSQMFERHENDYWDAALEGAGDFVLIYDKLSQETNYFFDFVRPREMQGDYFILFILLLYQHYSIVLFSKKIAEIMPSQSDYLEGIGYNHPLYKKLRKLKLEINLFLANSVFEAVGQITDVCNLYTFIEDKLQIKKNIETIYKGVENISSICENQIRDKEEDKEKKISNLIALFGMLTIISIVVDAMSLISWFKDDWGEAIKRVLSQTQSGMPIVDVLFCSVSLLVLILLACLGINAIRLFKRYKK